MLLDIMVYNREYDSEEDYQRAETSYLTLLVRLRQMYLLIIEDIQEYDFVLQLLKNDDEYFPEKRLRFLVEWDPTALTRTDDDPSWPNGIQVHLARHSLPLHHATVRCSTIQGFRSLFEYGILYYPNRKGIILLFTKDDNGVTPFQLACEKQATISTDRCNRIDKEVVTQFHLEETPFDYRKVDQLVEKKLAKIGRDEVMEVIEEVLTRYQSSEGTPQLNIADALMLSALDDNVHLDCTFLLLRRHPDVLVQLLHVAEPNNNSNNNINNNDDGGIHDANENDEIVVD